MTSNNDLIRALLDRSRASYISAVPEEFKSNMLKADEELMSKIMDKSSSESDSVCVNIAGNALRKVISIRNIMVREDKTDMEKLNLVMTVNNIHDKI